MNSTFKKSFLITACAAGAALCQVASAIPFTLNSLDATHISGNTVSAFYEVSGAGAESGTAANLYSASLGGNEDDGFWVTISFDGNAQPILTSAFLKAANGYLWWDATDLSAFNAGTFDSITLNNKGADGIVNGNNKYQGTSHAGLNGTPGVNPPGTTVPDGGATVLLLGSSLLGVGLMNRRKA